MTQLLQLPYDNDMSVIRATKISSRYVLLCVAICTVILIATLVFFHFRGSKITKSDEIITKVSKLYLLPNTETPTVARLEDKDRIDEGKEFYKNAKNGDYLLVYRNEKLALLYRENIDKLIYVSPVVQQ